MRLHRPPGRVPLHVQATPAGSEWTENAIPLASGWRSSAMVLITDPELGARAQFEALR
ncbi:hypothetical protein ACFQZO_28495 [Bradyrhizobium sp. GCM10027634]|uniref:hypothetical protein n=1 Tax=unclassified Bradyrhizobium TaxID=2631580 RepID=UPI00188B4A8C|nr:MULTISPECIES: hypothetical protein [unclassified Bradyrhizobium]MDN5004797.1 hypothetical protein [Bradyrhizobium sp. WYCCWR 12677]